MSGQVTPGQQEKHNIRNNHHQIPYIKCEELNKYSNKQGDSSAISKNCAYNSHRENAMFPPVYDEHDLSTNLPNLDACFDYTQGSPNDFGSGQLCVDDELYCYYTDTDHDYVNDACQDEISTCINHTHQGHTGCAYVSHSAQMKSCNNDTHRDRTCFSDIICESDSLFSKLASISGRPCAIDSRISFPQVDPNIVFQQQAIIASQWPKLTQEAWQQNPDFAALYTDILSFSLPNFLGARRTLDSGLHLHQWELMLQDYHDNEICFFLRYGWPVGYHSKEIPVTVLHNHQSADAYPAHIEEFIATERKYHALIGPFDKPPFSPWMRQSPMMTRPKKDSSKRRVIIDLSYPEGLSVNDGIDINCIYGRNSTYTLPSINDLTAYVVNFGQSAWLWKADLQRAYRQLRIDPIDTPLFGLQFNNRVYVDVCPSFGCRSSSSACYRVTAAVTYLMRKKGWVTLAFLDDFAGVQKSKQEAWNAYRQFLELAKDLGLTLAQDKCAPPSQVIEWLGYQVDVSAMTVTIPSKKLHQVLQECQLWSDKGKANQTMIQSLIGKLLHVANCIRHARKFVTRILSTLRYMVSHKQAWTTITPPFRADISWFLKYAEEGNGIALIAPTLNNIYIECDSSLTGGGGNSNTLYYAWKYSDQHLRKYDHIHQLEAINLLVAYRTLCPRNNTQGSRIVMITDNMASSMALSTGKTKDAVLAACARNLWLEAAKADHEIAIQHRHGTLIPLADALSRQHFDSAKAKQADLMIRNRGLNRVDPILSGYSMFDTDL